MTSPAPSRTQAPPASRSGRGRRFDVGSVRTWRSSPNDAGHIRWRGRRPSFRLRAGEQAVGLRCPLNARRAGSRARGGRPSGTTGRSQMQECASRRTGPLYRPRRRAQIPERCCAALGRTGCKAPARSQDGPSNGPGGLRSHRRRGGQPLAHQFVELGRSIEPIAPVRPIKPEFQNFV